MACYGAALRLSRHKPVWIHNLEVALLSAIATMTVLLIVAAALAFGYLARPRCCPGQHPCYFRVSK